MKILQLNDLSNQNVFVNFDNVIYFSKYENGFGTLIRFNRSLEKPFVVKETPEQIYKMLEEQE